MAQKSKESPFQKNKSEICWNLINGGIAGALVFVGAFADGNIEWKGILIAFMAALIIFVTKMRDYWVGQEDEYTTKLFKFL